jgi:hypothetical protein
MCCIILLLFDIMLVPLGYHSPILLGDHHVAEAAKNAKLALCYIVFYCYNDNVTWVFY